MDCCPPPLSRQLTKLRVKSSDVFVQSNPFAIFVRYDKAQADEVERITNTACSSISPEDYAEEPPVWVLVKYSDDKWYRAKITQFFEDRNGDRTRVEIVAIDYGFKTLVSNRQVFMPKKKAFELPPQCIKVMPSNLSIEEGAVLTNILLCHPSTEITLSFEKQSRGVLKAPYEFAALAAFTIGFKDQTSLVDFCVAEKIGHKLEFDQPAEPSSQSRGELPEESGSLTQRMQDIVKPSEEKILERIKARVGLGVGRSSSPESGGRSRASSSSTKNSVPLRGENSEADRETPSELGKEPRDSDDSTEASDDDLGGFDQRDKDIFMRGIKAEQSNKRRLQPKTVCVMFKKTGTCREGATCTFRHEALSHRVDVNEVGRLMNLPAMDLVGENLLFSVCTHVSEELDIYLTLPYGRLDLHKVLEKGENFTMDDIPVWKLQIDLENYYEPLLHGRVNTALDGVVHLVAAFVDEDDCGELKNVKKGWYRAMVLVRNERGARVQLPDHGATLDIPYKHLFALHEQFTALRRQACPCRLRDTTPSTSIDAAKAAIGIYRTLRDKLLVLRDARGLSEQNVEVDLFSHDRKIDYGEKLVAEGLLSVDAESDADTPDSNED